MVHEYIGTTLGGYCNLHSERTSMLGGKGDGVGVVVVCGMRQRSCTRVSPQCRSCMSVEEGLEAQASS